MTDHISNARQSIDEAGDYRVGATVRDSLVLESIAHSLIAIATELRATNAPVELRNVVLRGFKPEFGPFLAETDKEAKNG
ncbi:hypothetical protein [Timonella senegalensis]|uniref:hypothetical protein n=1 Tax=Timonella senegalensis TaxID=1465825 RepID=UPI0002EED4EF|nr:hypothetical protein [Timonella senegalensis]